MFMTDEEIRQSYAGAKKKREQIGILAELNCCDKSAIRAKLRELGFEVGEPGGNHSKPKVEESKKEEYPVVLTTEIINEMSGKTEEPAVAEPVDEVVEQLITEPVELGTLSPAKKKVPDSVIKAVLRDIAATNEEIIQIQDLIEKLKKDLDKYMARVDEQDRWLVEEAGYEKTY